MAENILGILFVTSSSGGRNVLRYPPDPFSPLTRLSQPYYPATTFTVKDTLTTTDRRQLFPPGYPGHQSKHSQRNGTTSTERRMLREWALGGSEFTGGTEGMPPEDDKADSGSDESSVFSEDDDLDNLIAPTRNRGVEDKVATSLAAKYDGSRRSSVALVDLHAERKQIQDEYMFNQQYDTALGYSLDFLGDMLTPPRSACNRKFEINVDELIFVGHPVTVGNDGKWAFPEEDHDLRPSARGRKRNSAKMETGEKDKTSLKTVIEGKEASLSPETDTEKLPAVKEDKDDAPHLNMFHLVIILDRPDPQVDELDHDGTNRTAYGFADEVYREIAFKWTAAAFALQVKENWIARNAWEITRLKEKCYNEGERSSESPHLLS